MTTLPPTDDTIVASATAWSSGSVGVIRLSGPHAIELVQPLCGALAHAGHPFARRARLTLDDSCSVPADVLIFPAPRSYTGQHLVEIHVCGATPLLREIASRLITLGARRALPGEFTARAYLNGKLDREQVWGVLSLIHANGAEQLRNAARTVGGARRSLFDELLNDATELLARVEAGIDFVDEEGVSFISPFELTARCSALAARTAAALRERAARDLAADRPHVALVGLPNAGKSTLFNALLGAQRAIVSPVIGTTRDVLSAPTTIAGVPIVLQDCAGLGHTPDEMEQSAHRAAERTADMADIVIWVHDHAVRWTDVERTALARIGVDRCILVLSRSDRSLESPPALVELPAAAETSPVVLSALTGEGVAELRQAIKRRLSKRARAPQNGDEPLHEFLAAIQRISALNAGESRLIDPELIALELRTACEALGCGWSREATELMLGRIFASFCIGK
ncbi:MAG: 50S ribosome-binding GTPase [Planctomycetia bacterium]|nr:MAG: 50S ribosome-binding GTPase [Planctomycetia bacterium]